MDEKKKIFIKKIVDSRRERLKDTGYSFYENDHYLIATEFLSDKRSASHIELVEKFIKIVSGMKVCEIGTGHGSFVIAASKQGADVYGVEVEPSICALSREIVSHYGADSDRIMNACGEHLPYSGDSFDLVVSSSVLEHVQDEQKVLAESIRVLKPGGIAIHNFPNYRSFFEGHFKAPWLPFLGYRSSKVWLRLLDFLTGNKHKRKLKDYDYVDTLKFVSLKTVSDMRKRFPEIEIISLGKEVWRERLDGFDLSVYWGVDWLARFIKRFRTLKLIRCVAILGTAFDFFTPIILVMRKPISSD